MGDSLLVSRIRPHRKTRTAGRLFAALVVAVLLFGLVSAAPAQAVHYTDTELAFVQLLNQYRAQNGLQPLLVSDMISEACDRHGSDMGKYRFFDHYTQASDWFAKGASPWIAWPPVATPTTPTRARTSPPATPPLRPSSRAGRTPLVTTPTC